VSLRQRQGLDRKRCRGIDCIEIAEVITVVCRLPSSEAMVEIALKHCPESQRVVCALHVGVLLLRVVAWAVENQVLKCLRFAQCDRQDTKYGDEESAEDCRAHVEPNQVDIGEYRLMQDNKVFLLDLTGDFFVTSTTSGLYKKKRPAERRAGLNTYVEVPTALLRGGSSAEWIVLSRYGCR
jgi:hypothetical protein